MKRLLRFHIYLFLAATIALTGSSAMTQQNIPSAQVMEGVKAEGACAVVGMTEKEGQLLALQRARSAAIEQAAGVQVTSASLVTDHVLAVDFIKTYTRGFIIREAVEWMPLGQYQKDPASPPIPEYRVRITADVRLPSRKSPKFGLQAKLNKAVFQGGEKVHLTIHVSRRARIAIFNIRADDKIALLFPHPEDGKNVLSPGTFVFPAKNSPLELEVEVLPGHRRDAEAYFIAAMAPEHGDDISVQFPVNQPLPFSYFFHTFSSLADFTEDLILPYEVISSTFKNPKIKSHSG